MANITRYNPIDEMVSLRSAIDHLFEDSFVTPRAWRTIANGEGITPAIDVHATDDEIVVSASLPGFSAEDVEITLTGQSLTLRGELKADETIARDQYLHRERRFGSFSRSFELPVRVQSEKAEASFANGVLTLSIPKAEDVKPRQVRITPRTEGDQA